MILRNSQTNSLRYASPITTSAQNKKAARPERLRCLFIDTEIFYGMHSLRPRNSGQQNKHMQKATMATFMEVAGAGTDSFASLEFISMFYTMRKPTRSTELFLY